jgi:dihydroneopterin aldolase
MGLIAIEGMEFFAYHGCFNEEQLIGTRFIVDVHLETDTREAETGDDLHKTVDYQAVYGYVKEEMEVSSKLLEHVGRRILNRIVKELPRVTNCRVKVAKLNPPVGGKVQAVSVELTT